MLSTPRSTSWHWLAPNDSFVQLVVRADSGIAAVGDLRGKRVGVGQSGSGTRVIALRVLRRAGLDVTDVIASNESLERAADGLRTRTLDAFFFVSGIPNEAIFRLSQDTGIRLVELESLVTPMAKAYGPEYVAGPIPASTYALPHATDTVSVKNYILAGVIGGGIIGTAVARHMAQHVTGAQVVLIEEDRLAAHQTGHNSGVPFTATTSCCQRRRSGSSGA